MGSIDISTPSKKWMMLVQSLSRKQASIIMQLRTVHIGLNKYLHHIQTPPTVPTVMQTQPRLSTTSYSNAKTIDMKDPSSTTNFTVIPSTYHFYCHINQPLFPCWNLFMPLAIWSKPSGRFAQTTRPQHKPHNVECSLIRAAPGTTVVSPQ